MKMVWNAFLLLCVVIFVANADNDGGQFDESHDASVNPSDSSHSSGRISGTNRGQRIGKRPMNMLRLG
ncbi:hypothetical protein P879_11845 [Paragonimus westermani]|uniref:Uncharacterized protein n=1 Tax=Paragonimus westermani TaxID=34504 RepID=A0A8T0D6M2_9TREM|nr:hypothetical protein P879_11845 [Paragonimus westermani]